MFSFMVLVGWLHIGGANADSAPDRMAEMPSGWLFLRNMDFERMGGRCWPT